MASDDDRVPDRDSASVPPGVCAECGAVAPDGPPLTWSVQTSPRGLQSVCERCTRANVRSIEAKLDSEWW